MSTAHDPAHHPKPSSIASVLRSTLARGKDPSSFPGLLGSSTTSCRIRRKPPPPPSPADPSVFRFYPQPPSIASRVTMTRSYEAVKAGERRPGEVFASICTAKERMRHNILRFCKKAVYVNPWAALVCIL